MKLLHLVTRTQLTHSWAAPWGNGRQVYVWYSSFIQLAKKLHGNIIDDSKIDRKSMCECRCGFFFVLV